jgi:2,3-bisphosphoglycerate-independent phosphoglycerate mutase
MLSLRYMKAKRVLLVILDGWGHGPDPRRSAIAQARTSFIDSLYDKYPHSELITHGELVGLPEGQMGNSEVGHMNIGAGRVVYQELARINKAIRDGELRDNAVLREALAYAKKENKALHLLGLLSDGGVHSHIDHLLALCDIAAEQGLENIYVHAFTDGRDTDPKGGLGYLRTLLDHIEHSPARLATVVGRYYAMDRDKRWERTKAAYDLLTKVEGEAVKDVLAAVRRRYEKGETDEFLKPIVALDEKGKHPPGIQPGDVVLCFNFRTDRLRQLTAALNQKDLPEHGMRTLDLRYVTMTRYDETYQGIDVIFEKEDVRDTLGEVLSRAGKTQVRIAETEKYPHVTFFFNGGREAVFEGEHRILIPSPKVATYDLKPEMSANEVTDAIVEYMKAHRPDFICLNYANADMVGHTGVFEAAVKATETVDACMARLIPAALKQGYTALVIADHGNSDYMINDDGSPNTAHTKNPVPCFLISEEDTGLTLADGKLGDIAPTILTLFDLPIPSKMTGQALIQPQYH